MKGRRLNVSKNVDEALVGGGELPHNLLDDEHAHYFPSHHFSSLFESFIRFYIKGESIWTDWRMKPLK
jgi:hypothetical protein